MDIKAKQLAALRRQPRTALVGVDMAEINALLGREGREPLHVYWRRKCDELRREREEIEARSRIRLTPAGWFVVAALFLEVVAIPFFFHECKSSSPSQTPALQEKAVAAHRSGDLGSLGGGH